MQRFSRKNFVKKIILWLFELYQDYLMIFSCFSNEHCMLMETQFILNDILGKKILFYSLFRILPSKNSYFLCFYQFLQKLFHCSSFPLRFLYFECIYIISVIFCSSIFAASIILRQGNNKLRLKIQLITINNHYKKISQLMQNRRPQKLSIPPKLQVSGNGGSPGSSPRRRKNPTFITQKAQGPYGKVNEYHNKLNTEIDNMDQKIQNLIQKHEAEFILAYRNHVKKVRQEMEEIKKRASSNNQSSSTLKVQLLEKQLVIFRQEALGLFDKITVRQLELQQARNRISELQTEKNFNQQTIKKLMKRTKLLEANQLSKGIEQMPSQHIKIRQNPIQNFYPQTKLDAVRTGSVVSGTLKRDGADSRPFTTAIGSSSRRPNRSIKQRSFYIPKYQSQNQPEISEKIKDIVGIQKMDQVNRICQVFSQYAQKMKTIISGTNTNAHRGNYSIPSGFNHRERRSSTGKYQYWKMNSNINKDLYKQSQSFSSKSQLQQFFYTCIQNSRKQIMRRKNVRSINFYVGQQMNLQQFKKIDTFRLIQMLVSNQKIISGLHAMIFGEKYSFFKN